MTTFLWSRLSDFTGRKPVVLIGLFGLSASMYSFGVSRTFVGVVMSRSLAVILNGNLVIMKSMIAELTDGTNIARAYAYQPIAWSTAETIGYVNIFTVILQRHAHGTDAVLSLKAIDWRITRSSGRTLSPVIWTIKFFEGIPVLSSLRHPGDSGCCGMDICFPILTGGARFHLATLNMN